MSNSFFKSITWAIGLQWRVSKFYFGWNIGYSIFEGGRPIAAAFILSELLGLVGRIAFGEAKGEYTAVYLWLAALLLLAVIYETLGSIDWYFKNKLQIRMRVVFQELLIFKMYELSQEQFDDQAFNTKIGRAQESPNSLWRIVNDLTMGMSAAITLVSALIAIAFTSYWVALVVVVSLVPNILARIKVNTEEEKAQKQREPDRRLAVRSNWMLIDPKQMVEVRLLNAFKKIAQIWRQHQEKADGTLTATRRRLIKVEVSAAVIQPLVNFGANIHLFQKLILAKSPNFDTFIFLRTILEETLYSATRAAEAARSLHSLAIDLQNFDEVYRTAPAIADGQTKIKPPLQIEFNRVSFKYPGTEEMVLKDLTFKIKPGDHLALVGENGAGKTTILKLLMRQYLPTEGVIKINNTDIRNLSGENYYRLIGHLSQEFFLPEHLTIRENLLAGIAKPTSEKLIWQATDLAKATAFIKSSPKGLETRLTPSFDDGTDFSAGQRQRICIARTLLRDAELLVLDEPTSAIDAKAEYSIFSNIYARQRGKVVLIVSHRFSTVRKADKILVIRQGGIVEQGTHAELMEMNGLYKEMFDIQAEGYH